MTLAKLEASKAQLQTALDEAVANYTALRHKFATLQSQRNLGKTSVVALSRLGEQVQAASREVERRRASIAALEEEIRRAHLEEESSRLRQLQEADVILKDRLEAVRAEITSQLAGLADLLRLHSQLVEKKDRVARELWQLSGKDCRYANYIDCAILRKSEYEGDLEYAVEAIKRLRVVA